MPAKKSTTKKNTQKSMNITGNSKPKNAFYETASLFLLTATVFLVIMIIIGILFVTTLRRNSSPANTITVSGTGEVFAVPDVATVNVTMRSEEKDVTDAQGTVTTQANKVIAALKQAGVAEKDIKTSNYSSNPRYEYQRKPVVCPEGADCFSGDSERVLVGYEVQQTLTIKIRKIDDAGRIVGILGGLDVEYINGPYFAIDDPDGLQAEARELAIEDARSKAEALASKLDVRLGKLVNFNEEGNYPIAYAERSMMASYDMAEEAAMLAPELPTGENQVTSNVTLTFKVK